MTTQANEGNDAGAQPGAAARVTNAQLRAALIDGLGVRDLGLPDTIDAEFMESLGKLLREMTQGTIDLLRARAEAKSSLHADMTMIGAGAVNPFKAAWDADVALRHLLAPRRADIQKPVQAVMDAYADLTLHDQGLAAGIDAALRGLLKRFSPTELEQKLTSKSAFDSILPGSRKARLWDLLNELYGDLSVDAEKDFWSVFEREFRRAYTVGSVASPSAAR